MSRGRNKELINERDRKLFERFYYWSEVKRLRFDDTIRKLSTEEFFLAEATTLRIVRRMLMDGATVDGKAVEKSRHQGFRSSAARRESCAQLSLFPE
jgi:hypothetical protein|nr:MAG TPA: hypothetical protein [Caudoviricetes sp.]